MKHYFFHPLVVFIITLLCVSFWITSYQNGRASSDMARLVEQLQESVNHEKESVAKLQAKVIDVDDPIIIEKVARDELLMQKDNEVIIQVSNPPPAFTTLPPQDSPTLNPLQQWRKLLLRVP